MRFCAINGQVQRARNKHKILMVIFRGLKLFITETHVGKSVTTLFNIFHSKNKGYTINRFPIFAPV